MNVLQSWGWTCGGLVGGASDLFPIDLNLFFIMIYLIATMHFMIFQLQNMPRIADLGKCLYLNKCCHK